jgi:hypothetical protein
MILNYSNNPALGCKFLEDDAKHAASFQSDLHEMIEL